MKKRTLASVHPMELGIESQAMVFYFSISFVIHLIFIGFVVFWPESTPRPRLGQGAINVSLVSLPGPPKAAPAPAPKAAAKTVAVPKKEIKQTPKAPVIKPSPPKPAKTVSLAPKHAEPKVKKSLKKKTQNRQKMIDQALTSVQKNVASTQSDSVKQAIDRLKKKVAQNETGPSRSGQTPSENQGATNAGNQGPTGSGGKRTLEITDLYKIEVAFQVERHWAFSQQLAGEGRAQQASLVFRVLPSGEITDIRFTQKSGNAYLDESAYKAIVKANPVSPHPPEIRTPYVTVALRFTPEGLKK